MSVSGPTISKRAREAPESPIRKLMPLADATRACGVDVYPLNIGDPDISAPQEFREALRRFDKADIPYEPSRGSPALRKAWSLSLNTQLGIETANEDFIITDGASEALSFTMNVCADRGDDILVLEPFYANYKGFAQQAGVNLVPVETKLEDGFAPPSMDAIASRLTPRTRAILLNSPNNPTGAVSGQKFLFELLDFCERRNLFLIADETYREIVFDGLKPLSVLQLAPGSKRVVMIDSFSKRYSSCGARIGCFVSQNPEIMEAAGKLASIRLAVSTIGQYAATYILEHTSPKFVADMTAEFQSRRDVIFDALQAIPGVTATRPQGAFYLLARLPVEDSEHFVKFMLQQFRSGKETTFVAPAAGFYAQEGRGRNEIRIAYVLKKPNLKRAIEILGEGLEAYKKVA